MLQIAVIGNIGNDAELRSENGSEFITFKVAHNERYTDANGNTHDTTQWISCVMNGNGGGVLKYLTKGQQVYVVGDGSVRTYHSKTQRMLVAGVDIRVRSVQLVGGRADAVPSVLFDTDGVQVNVTKYYNATGKTSCKLFSRSGEWYDVDENGWLSKQATGTEPAESATTEGTDGKPFI